VGDDLQHFEKYWSLIMMIRLPQSSQAFTHLDLLTFSGLHLYFQLPQKPGGIGPDAHNKIG